MINLNKSMGPGWDLTRNPWICSQTRMCCQTCYQLRYAAQCLQSVNTDFDEYFQIHWFSIFNSFMMVIFLVGLVSMILMRTLRKDYARYSKEDDIDDMVG